MTRQAGQVAPRVLAIAQATLARCSAIEAASGLSGLLAERPFARGAGAAGKAERNFFYLALTRALGEAAGVGDTAALADVEAGIYFLYRYAMHLDAAVDRQAALLLAPAGGFLVLALAQFERGLGDGQRYRDLRVRVFDRLRAMLATVEMERFDGAVPRWGHEGYASIAHQKCALAEVVPYAVCALAGDAPDGLCDALVESLAHAHVGMQWIDDLADLARDRARRQPSLLWARMDDWAVGQGLDLATVDDTRLRQLAYVTGLATRSIQEAIAEFEAAKACVDAVSAPLLHLMLDDMIAAQKGNCALVGTLVADAARRVAA